MVTIKKKNLGTRTTLKKTDVVPIKILEKTKKDDDGEPLPPVPFGLGVMLKKDRVSNHRKCSIANN